MADEYLDKPIALDETLQAVNSTLVEIKDKMVTRDTYANKVIGGQAGNIAKLKDDGDIADAGMSVEDIVEIAEGRTATYIVNLSQNASFNSQADSVTADKITTVEGDEINVSDLKKGEIILVTDTNVPDRWFGGTNIFYKMETAKVDLTNYYTKSVTDGLLNYKVDKVEGKQLSTNDYTNEDKLALEQACDDVSDLQDETTELKENLTELSDEVGINLWDEEWEVGGYDSRGLWSQSYTTRISSKHFFPIESGKVYYFKIPTSGFSRIVKYNANQNFIGTIESGNGVDVSGIPSFDSDVKYIKFSTNGSYGDVYNHDICINISNPSINGTYYPFGGLRGNLTELEQKAITSTEEETYEPTVPRDADTLGGISASEYMRNVYSDDEVKIGEWFGQDLYRRVFVYTGLILSTQTDNKLQDDWLIPGNNVISLKAILKQSDGSFVENSLWIGPYIYQEALYLKQTFTGFLSDIYVVVEYVK